MTVGDIYTQYHLIGNELEVAHHGKGSDCPTADKLLMEIPSAQVWLYCKDNWWQRAKYPHQEAIADRYSWISRYPAEVPKLIQMYRLVNAI